MANSGVLDEKLPVKQQKPTKLQQIAQAAMLLGIQLFEQAQTPKQRLQFDLELFQTSPYTKGK